MNLGQFIDTFKDAIAQRVVESYPPLYRPSENGHKLPRLLRKPLGAQEDAIKGRGPLPRSPPGHHRRRRDGHRQDLHRRRRRTSGGPQAGPGPLPAPSGAQVEAGGGDDGARRPRRHRQVHHRPGAAAPLRRLRPPLRGDEPGEGQAVLPLDARRDTSGGQRRRAGSFGTRRRASRSGCPAAPTARLRSWTRTAFPSPTRT